MRLIFFLIQQNWKFLIIEFFFRKHLNKMKNWLIIKKNTVHYFCRWKNKVRHLSSSLPSRPKIKKNVWKKFFCKNFFLRKAIYLYLLWRTQLYTPPKKLFGQYQSAQTNELWQLMPTILEYFAVIGCFLGQLHAS
jgi:hypothetical protein